MYSRNANEIESKAQEDMTFFHLYGYIPNIVNFFDSSATDHADMQATSQCESFKGQFFLQRADILTNQTHNYVIKFFVLPARFVAGATFGAAVAQKSENATVDQFAYLDPQIDVFDFVHHDICRTTDFYSTGRISIITILLIFNLKLIEGHELHSMLKKFGLRPEPIWVTVGQNVQNFDR
uniref:Uncharacterized protein n=1 Tax=Romanomermis culicivorax TaxID=13658 RepID=A0A915K9I3_ROMCU